MTLVLFGLHIGAISLISLEWALTLEVLYRVHYSVVHFSKYSHVYLSCIVYTRVRQLCEAQG